MFPFSAVIAAARGTKAFLCTERFLRLPHPEVFGKVTSGTNLTATNQYYHRYSQNAKKAYLCGKQKGIRQDLVSFASSFMFMLIFSKQASMKFNCTPNDIKCFWQHKHNSFQPYLMFFSLQVAGFLCVCVFCVPISLSKGSTGEAEQGTTILASTQKPPTNTKMNVYYSSYPTSKLYRFCRGSQHPRIIPFYFVNCSPPSLNLGPNSLLVFSLPEVGRIRTSSLQKSTQPEISALKHLEVGSQELLALSPPRGYTPCTK